jgi:hypothetical protein
LGRGLLAGGSGPASISNHPYLETKTNRKSDKVHLVLYRYASKLDKVHLYYLVHTSSEISKANDAAMPPVCKICSASDVGRACAAQCHPARVAAGMRAGALRPSGSVWLATPGRDERDYPDADSCPRRMSRTHARTGGRRANGAARLPLCRSASRFKLAWQSSAFLEADGRSAYHRTQTVAAACNPLGATTIVLHSRKEGTFVRPNAHASDAVRFP